MSDIKKYVADRVVFCRGRVKEALARGDEKDAQEWQQLVEMWQESAHFDEAFAKPETEEGR